MKLVSSMNSNQITAEEITKSKLLAKAVVEKDGKVFIVAVFERSEYYRFFFRFQAKSKRSPRKSWKYLPGQYYIMNAGTKNHTLESFMQANYPGREFKVRYAIKKKYVLTFFDRVGNPFKNMAPAEARVPFGATFDKANARPAGKWFNNRNRSFDSLPIPNNEVLVYDDFCNECGTRHSIAHFPAGNTKCMDMTALRNNPGLEYTGHRDGIFKFRYRINAF